MNTDNDDSQSGEAAEKKAYGLWGRLILFLFIAGPTSVFAFGFWARVGAGGSTNAVSPASNTLSIGFILWIVGMVGSAIAIFKK